MRNLILWTILIAAVVLGAGTLIYYALQDYNYSLVLKDEIPANEIYLGFSFTDQFKDIIAANPALNSTTIPTPKIIQYVSIGLGDITYENKGSISRSFEFPRLLACVDPSQITGDISQDYQTFPLSVQVGYSPEPVKAASQNPNPFEIFAQYNVNSAIEVKAGQTVKYYANIKNVYLNIRGENSDAIKGMVIKVYELPNEAPNPINPLLGGTYSYGNCQSMTTEDPLKTIKVV